jgi:hypothetical protein
MINLILFILIGVGITNLAVNASILDIPRDFVINKTMETKYFSWVEKLISCMMCSGFWVGFLMSIDSSLLVNNPIYGGAIISVCSYLFGSIVDNLDLSVAIKGSQLGVEEAEEDKYET